MLNVLSKRTCAGCHSSAAKIEDHILKNLQLVNGILFVQLYVLLHFLNKHQALILEVICPC